MNGASCPPFGSEKIAGCTEVQVFDSGAMFIVTLPYMEFAYSSFSDTLGKTIADKGDLSAGLDAWQKTLVDYGTQQGFDVNK